MDRIESDDMFAVCLATVEIQGRVTLEDPVLLFGPAEEDFTLEGSKFRQAVTASSCCLHACSELRRGIFERACRISFGDLHGPFME